MSGNLVTNINDKRIQPQINTMPKVNSYINASTGYAANIPEDSSDILKPTNRVFYDGEINPAKTKQDELVEPLLEQFYDNGKKLPPESELQSRVKTGELIYVKDYTKNDGTKVSGYYRRCPNN